MGKNFSIRITQKAGKHPRMMLLLVGAMSVAVLGLLAGCNEDPVEVDTPPSAPDGVFSITGDGLVTICWNPNPESDIAGYDVYWNDEPTGFFEYVGTAAADQTCYDDYDVDNGVTYFYAVLARDEAGQESELSYEDVDDTPRPEGTGLVLFDYLGQDSMQSGYDFSSLSGTPQAWGLGSTDVYFGAPNGVPTLFAVRPEVDVQDYGYIELEWVDEAPPAGWADSGRVELIEGHSYIIRILDQGPSGQFFNMAKVYVRDASPVSATLDWAYQIAPDNLELAPGLGGAQQ